MYKATVVIDSYESLEMTGLILFCFVCSGGLHRYKIGKGTARKKKKNIFVGRYRVQLRFFEKLALPALEIPPPQSPKPPQGTCTCSC